MKKVFILKASVAKTSKEFSLNDLPGDGGRMDIVSRCVNSTFFLSHDIRRDTEFVAVFEGEPSPPVTMRFIGNRLKYLSPDERCIAGLIKKGLEKVENIETESTPGIYVSKKSFREVIEEIDSEIIYLHEEGEPLETIDLEGDSIAFVLGDHIGLTQEDEALLKNSKKVSISPMVLHADHCIIIVHNVFDRKNL